MPTDRLYLFKVFYFAALHLLPLGALWSGAGTSVWVAAAVLYLVRIWFITAGYHCYFSHRAFKTSRVFQFVLALGAQTSGQGSVLSWGAVHRYHHAHSDQPEDLHSPNQRSFWYAHIGWLLRTRYLEVAQRRGHARVAPELVWLDRFPNLPWMVLAVVTWLVWGWPGLFIGYGLSTVATYHATFCVNSLTHRFGSRAYPTPDLSRNNWFVALIMLGGGWHNNHHHCPRAARQGHRWWQIDITYYLLVVLSWLRVVRDIHQPDPAMIHGR